MYQKATFYQNAQVNKDIKILFVWSKKRNYFQKLNGITKLETKFAEKGEKNEQPRK